MARDLSTEEIQKLDFISKMVEELRTDFGHPRESIPSRIAGAITKYIGSWHFIALQALLLAGWLFYNKNAAVPIDTYPYTLLGLVMAIEAAFILPIILLAQNRSEEKDRRELRRAHRTIDHLEQLLNVVIEKLDHEDPE